MTYAPEVRARILHDAGLMRELLGSESWACYRRAVEMEMAGAMERVVDCPVAEVEAHRSRWRGLRDAVQVPERLLTLAERVTDATR